VAEQNCDQEGRYDYLACRRFQASSADRNDPRRQGEDGYRLDYAGHLCLSDVKLPATAYLALGFWRSWLCHIALG
jgi:hypothetical protein